MQIPAFVKGFYVKSNGHVEDAWLNMGLIKSFVVTDVHINHKDLTLQNVLKCDMGSESYDKTPYVDANKAIVIKSGDEVFALAMPRVEREKSHQQQSHKKSSYR